MKTPIFPIEWPTVALIAATYGLWFLAGAVLYDVAPALALLAMAILCAQHSSLVHEIIHGHPTRNCTVNESLVFANPALIWPYHRFRKMHLCHHADDRLTDPFDDPESYYRALPNFAKLPRWFKAVLSLSNTLVGRLIFGPILGTIALFAGDAKRIFAGDRSVQKAWALHALGLIPILFCIIVVFEIPLWLYAITACYGGAMIISLRTFAEHQWHETPEGRTIIVERSPLSILYLNNNLHLVHHQHPTVPWYALPALYREKRDYFGALNYGYVYPNYWKLFRSYALMAKEPVAHPAWHRSKETE